MRPRGFGTPSSGPERWAVASGEPARAPLQNQSVRFRATMLDEAWRATARSAISALYDVRESDTFRGGRQAGFTMVGDFKARPNLPPRAQEIRTLFVIQETPRGRISTVWVGERKGFEARQKECLAVAAGATPF